MQERESELAYRGRYPERESSHIEGDILEIFDCQSTVAPIESV
jgi:hypothetical protein